MRDQGLSGGVGGVGQGSDSQGCSDSDSQDSMELNEAEMAELIGGSNGESEGESEVESEGEDMEEDVLGPDAEVMPVARVAAAARLAAMTLCCYACAQPEMTDEEVEVGYCSGRRCKAKMHAVCFSLHAGEAGTRLDDITAFCQACWAKQ